MEKLKSDIMNFRAVSAGSLNAYTRNINLLSKQITGEDYKNLDFLNKINDVKKFLETNKPSTKKTRIASILVALRMYPDKEELYKKYSTYLDEVAEKYYKDLEEKKKTLKESENWLSKKDLIKVYNSYARDVKNLGLNKKTKIALNNKERKTLQDYLIISLYTLIPPRRVRDFALMTVINKSDFDELSDEKKNSNNYLVIESKTKKFFNIGDYKSNNQLVRKNKGVYTSTVPKKLNTVINIWWKFNKNNDKDFLLYNNRGRKLTSNGLTKHLQRIFSITGKKHISSSMLRHIEATENEKLQEYRKVKKEAEKIADDFGHSLKENENYVRK
jgi:hypothetical protein